VAMMSTSDGLVLDEVRVVVVIYLIYSQSQVNMNMGFFHKSSIFYSMF
jgi:hypothetical protein